MIKFPEPVSRPYDLSRFYRIEVETMRSIRSLIKEIFPLFPSYQEAMFDFMCDTENSYYNGRKDSARKHDA